MKAFSDPAVKGTAQVAPADLDVQNRARLPLEQGNMVPLAGKVSSLGD
jgi:hypothetical protein